MPRKPQITESQPKPAESEAPHARVIRIERTPAIAALVNNRLIPQPQGLPETADECERLEGLDIYERMAWSCPSLNIAYRYLQDRVFESGLTLVPAIDPPKPGEPYSSTAEEYEQALKICNFCSRNLEWLEEHGNSLQSELERMFTAVYLGHSLAELTFDYDENGMIRISKWRYIPRKNYGLVFDPYGKFLGALGAKPGHGFTRISGIIPKPESLESFVAADRLVLLRFQHSIDHPGGQSLFRAAYRSFKTRRDVEGVLYGSMVRFAGGAASVAAPENGQTEQVINGVKKTIIEHMADVLSGYQSGSSLVLPYGTEVLEFSGGSGNAEMFSDFFSRVDRELAMTILYTASALYEVQRNSEASAGQSENITDVATNGIKAKIAPVLRSAFQRLVRMNFGDSAVRFTPMVAFADIPNPDRAAILGAMATAMGTGVITYAMLPKLWRQWLGEDYRPDPEMEAAMKAAASQSMQQKNTKDTDQNEKNNGQ